MKKNIKKLLSSLGYTIVKRESYIAASPHRDSNRKIFGIGYNKTATTSLEKIFRNYNLAVPNQYEQELVLTEKCINGDYSSLKEFVLGYSAFQDVPFSIGNVYVACDALFPGSKFILTLRDTDTWYESINHYTRKVFGFDEQKNFSESDFKNRDLYLQRNHVYEVLSYILCREKSGDVVVNWNLFLDENYYKDMYERRNEAIQVYFRNRRQDFLALDLSKEDSKAKIASFLNLPELSAMPHENKR